MMELHLSSTKRGADNGDNCEQEFGNIGRGMQGVRGLCGVVVGIVTGTSVILGKFVCGSVDWGLFLGSEYSAVVACSVIDWVDVGLGGWAGSCGVCTSACWSCSLRPWMKVVFSVAFSPSLLLDSCSSLSCPCWQAGAL